MVEAHAPTHDEVESDGRGRGVMGWFRGWMGASSTRDDAAEAGVSKPEASERLPHPQLDEELVDELTIPTSCARCAAPAHRRATMTVVASAQSRRRRFGTCGATSAIWTRPREARSTRRS